MLIVPAWNALISKQNVSGKQTLVESLIYIQLLYKSKQTKELTTTPKGTRIAISQKVRKQVMAYVHN